MMCDALVAIGPTQMVKKAKAYKSTILSETINSEPCSRPGTWTTLGRAVDQRFHPTEERLRKLEEEGDNSHS
ncbi:hypothetical protein RRG08_036879 [Elysia crispata]|uniref:Uncharacterized protein n=1 Tax=Elysia crispata TaxID=231223 RepID=A0AAE1AZN0_9GAST|nr:hypothetical protein RRG08_036879 [Elysia crispata]